MIFRWRKYNLEIMLLFSKSDFEIIFLYCSVKSVFYLRYRVYAEWDDKVFHYFKINFILPKNGCQLFSNKNGVIDLQEFRLSVGNVVFKMFKKKHFQEKQITAFEKTAKSKQLW